MIESHPRHTPVWEDVSLPQYPALSNDVTADVCIIGSGIAGLSIAYHLVLAGKSVVVLEDGGLCTGQTACTTAHLANAIDDRFTEMERLHGTQGAVLAGESHFAAIDRIEEIVSAEGIACDFQRLDGFLFLSPGDSPDVIEHEYAAARRAGVLVEKLPRVPLEFDTGPCLRFHRQGQFHPLKYVAGLAAAITSRGGQIFCNTRAASVNGGNNAYVGTEGGPRVNARSLVVATNSPINDMVTIHTKQAPYITYAFAARIPSGSVPKALYWDTQDPYHYVRVQPDTGRGEMLIVGGEDHKTGQAHDSAERYSRLEIWARNRFPQMGPIEHRWAGQVMETIDGLAFIGRNPMDAENVYIVTGDSGMGMTHGTIAGMLISDQILGKENRWASLYSPSRKPLRAAGEYLKENLNVAAQYVSLLTPGDVSSPDDVKPGQSCVMRQGLSKVALHRTEEGELISLSAICPHLGCVVAWNEAESTWDCPCHGSRFNVEGHVINGPANSDLAPVVVQSEQPLGA